MARNPFYNTRHAEICAAMCMDTLDSMGPHLFQRYDAHPNGDVDAVLMDGRVMPFRWSVQGQCLVQIADVLQVQVQQVAA